MLVDGGLGFDPGDAVEAAVRAEEDGFDGVWCPETAHDPFLPLALAAEHTERVQLGTGIAVAFARSPMTTAVVANDLQRLSRGRFLLGLGSQIKPHIEKRYCMPWSHPAARMRAYVLALRAIWAAWHDGTRLAFRGEFYRHTLMTPMFSQAPHPYGPPKVLLAAVGPRMAEVAGEVGDGLLVHGFTTERYLREVTLPALRRGFAAAGRGAEGFEVSYPGMVVTGTTTDDMEAAAKAVRAQLAFYGSTPAYRPVLDLHGWGELHRELNRLSRRGAWAQMGGLIDDEVLATFAVVGTPQEVPGLVRRRFGDLVTRFTLSVPYLTERARRQQLLVDMRQGG